MKRFLFVLLAASVCCARAGSLRAEGTAARVPPLFWYESDPAQERRFVMALLLYWSARDHRDRLTLFAPLYYNSFSPDEQFRVLLPLHFLYRAPGQRMSLWGPYFSRDFLKTRTRFLFPLYYDSSDEEGRFRLLLLYLTQENKRARLDLVPPLFASYRPTDPAQNAYQAFLPFYFRLSSRDRRLLASPLFWAYREKEVSLGLIPPYFWRHAPGSKIEIGFPVYGRYLREKAGRRRDIQVAVPWFRVRSGSTTYRGFVPLYLGRTKVYEAASSTGEARLSEWDIVPGLFLRDRRPDGARKTVTPLYSRFRDRDGMRYGHTGLYFFADRVWGGRTTGIFPLYYLRSEPDFSRFRFLPFYRYREKGGKRAQVSLFPLFRYRRDWDRTQWTTPLFYSDRDPDLSRGFLLNYFWKTERRPDDPSRAVVSSRRFLFPLVWHSRSEKSRTTVLAPLAAFHESEDYRLSLLVPFYFSRTKGPDRFWMIPPLLARDSPQRHWRGLMFLYWQTARPDRSAVTLLPLFRRATFPGGSSLYLPGFYRLHDRLGSQGVAGPYLWDGRGKTQYRMFVPLYVDFRRPTWGLRALIPFYRFRNQSIDEKGFFPIWAVTKPVSASTMTVTRWAVRTTSGVSTSTETELIEQPVSTFTFTSYLANSHRVLPFYFYRKTTDGSELILPFILGDIERGRDAQGRRVAQGRALLLASWETGPDRLIHRFDPLYAYHRTPDRKGFVSPTAPLPLWRYEVFNRRSKDRTVYGAVFPYYWKAAPEARKDFVFPLYYHRRLNDTEKKKEKSELTWLLLYYASRDFEEGDSKRIVAPLYLHFADRQSGWTLMPLYWGENGPDYDRQVLFPFWWTFRRGPDRLRALFPLFLSSSDPSRGRSTVIVPGYWRSRSPEGSTLLAGNYFRRVARSGAQRTTAVFPLYWSDAEPGRRVRTVFPVYWSWKAEDRAVTYLFPLFLRHERPRFSWEVAFPVYWKFALEDQVVRVVPPYFSIDSLDTGTRTTGFAPLWTYARNKKKDWKDFQFLGGLAGYERSGAVRRFTFLYFLKI